MLKTSNGLLLLLVLLTIGITADCQDISGVWQGNYGKGNLSTDATILKVAIETHSDSLVRGTLTLSQSKGKYQRFAVSGIYRIQDSTIYISEDSGIALTAAGYRVLRDYNMKLNINGETMRFAGISQNHTAGMFTQSSIKVWMEKPYQPEVKTLELKPPVSPVSKESKLTQRPIRILKTIEVDEEERDSIRIEITDNARIDNDMISLYVNDSNIAYKELISALPLVYYIRIEDSNPTSDLIMVAESYGNMPPCTAFVKITTCKQTFVIDVESTYYSNGAIKIQLK